MGQQLFVVNLLGRKFAAGFWVIFWGKKAHFFIMPTIHYYKYESVELSLG